MKQKINLIRQYLKTILEIYCIILSIAFILFFFFFLFYINQRNFRKINKQISILFQQLD